MNQMEQDQLLRETLVDESAAALRQEILSGGLAAIRRRRRTKKALRSALLAIPLVVVYLGAWRSVPRSRLVPPPPASLQAPATPTASASDIPFISDEQLLALFPGRSVALIGKPGHQSLVVLK